MRRISSVCISGIVCTAILAFVLPRTFADQGDAFHPDEFKYRSACGPIAAFVALRTLNCDVAFDDIVRGCNWIEGGKTSLSDVASFINQQPGLSCSGVRMSLEQLRSFASSRRHVVILLVRKNSDELDHVLCATDWSNGRFTILDYPELRRSCDEQDLARRWDGQALLVSENLWHLWVNRLAAVVPAAVAVGVVVCAEGLRRARSRRLAQPRRHGN